MRHIALFIALAAFAGCDTVPLVDQPNQKVRSTATSANYSSTETQSGGMDVAYVNPNNQPVNRTRITDGGIDSQGASPHTAALLYDLGEFTSVSDITIETLTATHPETGVVFHIDGFKSDRATALAEITRLQAELTATIIAGFEEVTAMIENRDNNVTESIDSLGARIEAIVERLQPIPVP